MQLAEMRPWTGLNSSEDAKIWFNAKTGEAFVATVNHSTDAVKNQDMFGIDAADLQDVSVANVYDYDGRALFAAMKSGWVRLRIDTRQPDWNSNAEGTNLRDLRKALLWYAEQVGTPLKFIVVVRTGAGDKDGEAHSLNGDSFEWFIQKGSFARPHHESVSESIRRLLELLK